MTKDKDSTKEKDTTGGVKSRAKSTRGKQTEEIGDANTSVVSSPVTKIKGGKSDKPDKPDKQDKQTDSATQSTLDKHLKASTSSETKSMSDMLKNMQSRLDKLASQEYIEKKFKEMITETILNQKLNELKTSIKKDIQTEIDSVVNDIKVVTTRVTTLEATVETLRNQVSDLETKADRLEAENKELDKDKKDLEQKVNDQRDRIKFGENKYNILEQYTRRNSIRIYGVQDNSAETNDGTCKKVIKVINDKLGIKLSRADIDIAHRLGDFRDDGNRVIICKFVQRIIKLEVLRSRRALKGSSYVIREDLTTRNAKLLEAVSEHEKVKTCWSDEGRIVALLKNNRKFTVRNLSDLDSVSSEPRAPSTGTVTTAAGAYTHF